MASFWGLFERYLSAVWTLKLTLTNASGVLFLLFGILSVY